MSESARSPSQARMSPPHRPLDVRISTDLPAGEVVWEPGLGDCVWVSALRTKAPEAWRLRTLSLLPRKGLGDMTSDGGRRKPRREPRSAEVDPGLAATLFATGIPARAATARAELDGTRIETRPIGLAVAVW
jgi:hypothetical protein